MARVHAFNGQCKLTKGSQGSNTSRELVDLRGLSVIIIHACIEIDTPEERNLHLHV